MKKSFPLFALFIILFSNCNNQPTITSLEKTKAEIIETEKAFSAMEEGIAKAFLHYAADDAVLMRNNRLIKGKDSISV